VLIAGFFVEVGSDAIRLAAADCERDPDLVLAAGDSAIHDAATSEGMASIL